MISEIIINSLQDNISIPLNTKKNNTANRKKKKDKQLDITDEDVVDDNVIGWVTDGELPVSQGDRVIMSMVF